MTVDLILSVLHHLLAFALLGLLFAQFALVRPGLCGAALRRAALFDRCYGAFAGLLVVVGVLRVLFGLKGPDFYLASWSFWAKMATFLAIALLSIPPTLRIVAWSKAANRASAYAVPDAEIGPVRRWLHLELALFALLPVFAAMMARGIGL